MPFVDFRGATEFLRPQGWLLHASISTSYHNLYICTKSAFLEGIPRTVNIPVFQPRPQSTIDEYIEVVQNMEVKADVVR